MTDEPASLLLVYCDNILARILAQISANFHVKYNITHYTLLRKSAFSEGSCRELVRPLYARANYKKSPRIARAFFEKLGDFDKSPKVIFSK